MNTDFISQTFAYRGTTKAQTLQQNTHWLRAIHATKSKEYMKDSTYIQFIPDTHVEDPTRTLSTVACTPRKVHGRVTSDSDLCEADLDIYICKWTFLMLHYCTFITAGKIRRLTFREMYEEIIIRRLQKRWSSSDVRQFWFLPKICVSIPAVRSSSVTLKKLWPSIFWFTVLYV